MYNIDWLALLPTLLVAGMGLLVMLLSAFMEKQPARVGYFSLAGLLGIGVLVAATWASNPAPSTFFNDMVTVDSFSLFFYLLFIIIAAVSVLIAIPYLERDGMNRGEYYALMFFSLAGMFVLVSSNDLITLFLGFETMSLAIYVLAGYRRNAVASNEAALKYYFLGAFAAGIFLYGIAFLYGAVGSTNLVAIHAHLVASDAAAQPILIIGGLMVLSAVAFKIAAFPSHMWMPDVYEGAPTPVTAFMSTAVKAAAFALVMRVFLLVFGVGVLETIGLQVVWWLAILTMFVGNLFAMAQKNVKRMLAYSSVAHTGYLLVGVAALPDVDAGAAIMYYLVAYALTNLGALACLSFLQGRDERLQTVDDLAGAGWRYPLLGLGMAVFMFSLIGFPPFAGFFGKYYLFLAAIKAGLMPLVVIAVINSILSVYYYLRVVVVMFMRPEGAVHETAKTPTPIKVAVGYAMVAVIWAGIGVVNFTWLLPGAAPLIAQAKASAATLIAPGHAAQAKR